MSIDYEGIGKRRQAAIRIITDMAKSAKEPESVGGYVHCNLCGNIIASGIMGFYIDLPNVCSNCGKSIVWTGQERVIPICLN